MCEGSQATACTQCTDSLFASLADEISQGHVHEHKRVLAPGTSWAAPMRDNMGSSGLLRLSLYIWR
jgi:hypothetical protein